ncbi:MAG TPA: type II toxin-antitoxin system RelE/ParE family toxin [Gammaproteobacteria bacterium]|nr:type II toxin-antitoxin system RelE/ParE family toxin [Gammaproteobacteria bacterium]
MMAIFKNKFFAQWAEKQGLLDEDLVFAVDEMINGLYEANLGGHVFKKRLSFGGKSKRDGARTIIAFKLDCRCFFIYGFSKSKKDNITKKELAALKALAKLYLSYDKNELKKAINAYELVEVKR